MLAPHPTPQPPLPPRLRHLCLMVPRLDETVDALCAVFGLAVAHREPAVQAWGLRNAVLPVGGSFIEVCTPVRDSAPAQRFLQRRPEGGAYNVALDGVDLPRQRAHLQRLGLRLVTELDLPEGYAMLQLHPRDTGACMLEFNHTAGGDEPLGPYRPAGAHWQRQVRTGRVAGLRALTLHSRTPARLAGHWAQLLQTPLVQGRATGPLLPLTGGQLRFALAAEHEPAGVAEAELAATDAPAVLASAAARGLPVDAARASVRLAGVAFRLV